MTRLLVLVAAALTLAARPYADFTAQPPHRYRGDNWAEVRFVDPEKVNAACEEELKAPPLPHGRFYEACTIGTLMILPNPCTNWPGQDEVRMTFCHELGHRNGWPADHPAQ